MHLRGFLLVALLVRRRDHEPLKFMGHDLKQFKSLEGKGMFVKKISYAILGFLESGPQFALQSYILMIGQKKDTNIDFNNITEDDAGNAVKNLNNMNINLFYFRASCNPLFFRPLLVPKFGEDSLPGQCSRPRSKKEGQTEQEECSLLQSLSILLQVFHCSLQNSQSLILLGVSSWMDNAPHSHCFYQQCCYSVLC